jgi:YesN/AraC family two-component response regulator
VRLKKAAQELLDTDRFVQDISVSYGYRNDSYFCKVFKKEFGLTPAEYREEMRRKDKTEEEEPAT